MELLNELELEQNEYGTLMDRFLDMHMFITSALQRNDVKAIGLQMALDLIHKEKNIDLITGLKTRTQTGRPNWDKVIGEGENEKINNICVIIPTNICSYMYMYTVEERMIYSSPLLRDHPSEIPPHVTDHF